MSETGDSSRDPSIHEPAKEPNDLEKLFVERANAGDVEGLVALYEPNAVVADGKGRTAIGPGQIRELFAELLRDRPHLDPSAQSPALASGDLALTSSRLGNGDVTAEIARRQPDGSWRWVVDQFALASESRHAAGEAAPRPGEERVTARDAIRSAISSFNSAYRRGDIDTLLACYSEDLIKDRAGAPPETRAQTASRIRQVFAGHETDLQVEIAEIDASGDLAFVRGRFTVTLRPRGGGSPVTVARRYLEIWRNEAGSWRVIRTMDNEA